MDDFDEFLNEVSKTTNEGEKLTNEALDESSTAEQILRKKINEERFLWIFLIIIIVNCMIFVAFKEGLSSITLGVLQLVFLCDLGVKLGIESLLKLVGIIKDVLSFKCRDKP